MADGPKAPLPWTLLLIVLIVLMGACGVALVNWCAGPFGC